jgi:hypothetical protein
MKEEFPLQTAEWIALGNRLPDGFAQTLCPRRLGFLWRTHDIWFFAEPTRLSRFAFEGKVNTMFCAKCDHIWRRRVVVEY